MDLTHLENFDLFRRRYFFHPEMQSLKKHSDSKRWRRFKSPIDISPLATIHYSLKWNIVFCQAPKMNPNWKAFVKKFNNRGRHGTLRLHLPTSLPGFDSDAWLLVNTRTQSSFMSGVSLTGPSRYERLKLWNPRMLIDILKSVTKSFLLHLESPWRNLHIFIGTTYFFYMC